MARDLSSIEIQFDKEFRIGKVSTWAFLPDSLEHFQILDMSLNEFVESFDNLIPES